MKHSEGPWHVDGPLDNHGTDEEPTGSTWFDVISAEGHTVAHLNLDARPEGQHLNQVQADARLIAASTDLLEALVAVRKACKAEPAMNHQKYDGLGQQVVEAIIKARGHL